MNRHVVSSIQIQLRRMLRERFPFRSQQVSSVFYSILSLVQIVNISMFFYSLLLFKIIMSTWQQHALSTSTTNSATQLTHNHSLTHGSISIDLPDSLGEINHTSALSGDFGRLSFFPDTFEEKGK